MNRVELMEEWYKNNYECSIIFRGKTSAIDVLINKTIGVYTDTYDDLIDITISSPVFMRNEHPARFSLSDPNCFDKIKELIGRYLQEE